MNLSVKFEEDNMCSCIELFDTLKIHHTLKDFLKRFLTSAELLELSPYISEDGKEDRESKGTAPQDKDIEVQGDTILPILCTARLLELKELSNGEGIDDGCISRLILGSLLVDYIFGDRFTRDINIQVTGSAVKIYGTLTSGSVVAITIRTKERCKHLSFEANYGELGVLEHNKARVELDYYRIASLFSEDFKFYVGKIFKDSGYTLEYVRSKYVTAQVEIRKQMEGL